MKTRFTPLQPMARIFAGLILASMLLYSCSSDDDTPGPSVTPPDFSEVEDLPEVEDEDPEFDEPETGEVENSEETQELITNIMATDESGEVAEETKEKLNKVEEFTAQMPEEVNQKAQSLDESSVDAILDQEQELDGSLEALKSGLDEVPEEVAQLLPEISFTVDMEELADEAVAARRATSIPGLKDADFYSQGVNGPCVEAAQEPFDERMEELTDQRDANLEIIENNYTRRQEEAGNRFENRRGAQAEKYQDNKQGIKVTTIDILAAAAHAESIGETETAEQLRTLALIYAVEARASLEEWDELVLALLEEVYESELNTVHELRNSRRTGLTNAFQHAAEQAQAVLQEVLNKCHNQGSGN